MIFFLYLSSPWKSTDLELTEGQRVMYYRTILGLSTKTTHSVFINKPWISNNYVHVIWIAHSSDPCPFDNIEYFFSLHIELEWQFRKIWICHRLSYYCNSRYLHFKQVSGILLPKLFWLAMRKNCSSDRDFFWNSEPKAENLQKFWDDWNNLF